MRGQHSIFCLVTKTDKFSPEKNPPLLACSGNVSASDFFRFCPFCKRQHVLSPLPFRSHPATTGCDCARLLRRGQIHEARVHISLSVCQAGERGP